MFSASYFSARPLIVGDRSARGSADSSSLRPRSSMGMDDGLSPNGLQLTSPSDMVGPSPVTSNGTETTEIEDEASDDVVHEHRLTPPMGSGAGDPLANVCLVC